MNSAVIGVTGTVCEHNYLIKGDNILRKMPLPCVSQRKPSQQKPSQHSSCTVNSWLFILRLQYLCWELRMLHMGFRLNWVRQCANCFPEADLWMTNIEHLGPCRCYWVILKMWAPIFCVLEWVIRRQNLNLFSILRREQYCRCRPQRGNPKWVKPVELCSHEPVSVRASYFYERRLNVALSFSMALLSDQSWLIFTEISPTALRGCHLHKHFLWNWQVWKPVSGNAVLLGFSWNPIILEACEKKGL